MISCEIKGAELIKKELIDKYQEIVKKTKTLKEPLEKFRNYYLSVIKQNFYGEGKIFGDWPPLNPDYAVWKASEVGNLKMLQLYGALKKQLFNAGVVYDTYIDFMINLPYAKIHQVGGYANKGYIPSRPYFFDNTQKEGFRQQDINVLKKIIENYLIEDKKYE